MCLMKANSERSPSNCYVMLQLSDSLRDDKLMLMSKYLWRLKNGTLRLLVAYSMKYDTKIQIIITTIFIIPMLIHEWICSFVCFSMLVAIIRSGLDRAIIQTT